MLKFLKSIGYPEIILIQIIFWITLWLSYEYLASLLTIIFVPILFAILVVSIIAELIEKSKIPRKFFVYLLISVLIPSIIAIYVYISYDGAFDWLKQI